MTRIRVACVLALLAAAGCRNTRSELVEAELRTRERELREARGELWQAQAVNQAFENTLRSQQCAQPVLRPGGSFGGQIKDVQLGRGTGGIDEDKVPGDEGIQVVLVPRDVDGSAIKVPGTLRVTALEISPEGLKTPLSTWEVSVSDLRRTWRSGLFSTGYHVSLPWQKLPTTERLRIVATFQPLEGGVFEAEKDVAVKLLAEAIRGQLPVPGPAGLGPPLPAPPAGGLQPPVPIDTVPSGPMPRPTTPVEQIGPPKLPPTTEVKRWQPVTPVPPPDRY